MQRGITSTAAALAVAFEQQAAVAMPFGLAAAAAISAGLAGGAVTGGFVSGAGLIGVSKLAGHTGSSLVLAVGGSLVWQVRENHATRETSARYATAASSRTMALRQEIAALHERTAAVEADAAKLEAALHAARTAPLRLRASSRSDSVSCARRSKTSASRFE